MKIFSIGNGFIASHLNYPKIIERLESNSNHIEYILDKYKPNTVINCIGYCGGSKNIDQCEIEKTRTCTSNTVIPIMLAQACENRNIYLINIGSGCIFSGYSQRLRGWLETDIPNPVSYYGYTKYACDLAIGSMKNVTTLRIRMPISSINHQRNLLNKLISYKQVLETPNSVTFLEDLLNAIDFVIKNKKTGIYNITSPNPLTHSALLNEYKKYFPNHIYEKISEKELNNIVVAKRSNCILNSSKIINEGFKFENTDTRVCETVKRFVENLKETK